METRISMTGDNHAEWDIYSDDPYMQRRLEAAGAILLEEFDDYGHGKHYRMPANRITFRRPRKPLTAAQKAQRAAQLATANSGWVLLLKG